MDPALCLIVLILLTPRQANALASTRFPRPTQPRGGRLHIPAPEVVGIRTGSERVPISRPPATRGKKTRTCQNGIKPLRLKDVGWHNPDG